MPARQSNRGRQRLDAGPGSRSRAWTIFGILAGAQCVVVALAWVGFAASDDANYARGALAWMDVFPGPPEGHATMRYPLTLPIMASFWCFDLSEWSLVLPTLVYFALAFAVTFFLIRRVAGVAAATLTCMFFGTTPLFATRASFVNAEMPETLFAATSFWLFMLALSAQRRTWLLVGSGAAAAVAVATRETSFPLLLFYGLCFLFSRGMPRRFFPAMLVGFFAVLGAEAAYYAWAAGDPLHRFATDSSFSQREFELKPEWERPFDETSHRTAWSLNESSYIPYLGDHLSPWVMPFTRHEVGILFYALLPALIWFRRRRPGDETDRRRCVLLASGLAGVWFLFFAVLPDYLSLRTRYIDGAVYMASAVVALFIVDLHRRGRPRWAALLAVAVLGGNALGLLVENKTPIYGVRKTVEVAGRMGPVHTDPETCHRAEFLLQARDMLDSIVPEPPGPGDIYVHNPRLAGKQTDRFSPDQVIAHRPAADWEELERFERPPAGLQRMLEGLGLMGLVPAAIRKRLFAAHPAVVVYRRR